MPKPRKTPTSADRGIAEGYRSGLEEYTASYLKRLGVPVCYESIKLSYTKPTKPSVYTPDFPLPNGIIIETKGRFVTADRQKHKLIKQQHPDLDIRFIFTRSKTRISKVSKTTYAAWCDTNGFLWADRIIPLEWVREPPCLIRLAALERARKR